MLQTRVDSGLDGVIVADTVMSEVDGEAGRLTVRGHALEELVATRGFEGVAALLWDGYAAGGGDEAAVAACWAWEQEYLGMEISGTIHNQVRLTGPLDPPAASGVAGVSDRPSMSARK